MFSWQIVLCLQWKQIFSEKITSEVNIAFSFFIYFPCNTIIAFSSFVVILISPGNLLLKFPLIITALSVFLITIMFTWYYVLRMWTLTLRFYFCWWLLRKLFLIDTLWLIFFVRSRMLLLLLLFVFCFCEMYVCYNMSVEGWIYLLFCFETTKSFVWNAWNTVFLCETR